MRFMLDTNICVDIIRGRSPAVLQHLLRIPPSDVCISVITLSELEFGVAKSAAPERNHLALLERTSRFTGGEPYGNPWRGKCVSSCRDAGSPYGGSDCSVIVLLFRHRRRLAPASCPLISAQPARCTRQSVRRS
jgi:hypothetical protein